MGIYFSTSMYYEEYVFPFIYKTLVLLVKNKVPKLEAFSIIFLTFSAGCSYTTF